MEMELLDEKIRIWSTGKEGDIRLLLSTLHHVRFLYIFLSNKINYQNHLLCINKLE